MTHFLRLTLVGAAAVALGCSSRPNSRNDSAEDVGAPSDAGAPSNAGPAPDASVPLDLQILPPSPALEVALGNPMPEVQFTATSGGTRVDASFSLDRADLGSLSASGHFIAGGAGAGVGVVSARWGGLTASTTLTIHIEAQQNGATPDAGNSPSDGGRGGWGGVGGEGMGAAVSAPVETVLASDPVADPGLSLLYPLDGTVWPKGVLAPLLQWRSASRDVEAVSIELRCTSMHFRGTFSRTATLFTHHPIPPAVWTQVHGACAGEQVALRLVFASQGVAYGPLQATWKIASGSLKGTVYYNSYATRLAKNAQGSLGPESKFGGATLAITGEALEPTLVAGEDSVDESGCRVCHVVAARGSRLVTQHGEKYARASIYDLASPNQETVLSPDDGRFAWGALSPDGSLLFSNAAKLAGSWSSPSALYSLPSGKEVTTSGLPSGLCAGTPVFSNDGTKLAFNWWAGAVGGQSGDRRSLAVMDFAPPGEFSSFARVFTPSNPSWTAIYPSFTPDGAGLVFELELVNNGRDVGGTRSGCDRSGTCSDVGSRGELWWLDLATKQATRLDKLNGAGSLPKGPNGHDDDATLNYEPTVGPVASGGYAWVVFTSRRLYGNVATINPFWSDPRYHDISSTPTTKKLWVAAMDLTATPGVDPSHPAFYLPAQELLAGNSRGYWVAEVCREKGEACESGDQCCTGFCRPLSGEMGGLVCSDKPSGCAHEYELCSTDADCCAGASLVCVSERCTVKGGGPN
jgi:hypothetical protein